MCCIKKKQQLPFYATYCKKIYLVNQLATTYQWLPLYMNNYNNRYADCHFWMF